MHQWCIEIHYIGQIQKYSNQNDSSTASLDIRLRTFLFLLDPEIASVSDFWKVVFLKKIRLKQIISRKDCLWCLWKRESENLTNNANSKVNKIQWITCIFNTDRQISLTGQRFALMEEKCILALLMRNLKVKSKLRTDQMRVSAELVIRPLFGNTIRLEPRKFGDYVQIE